jgi:hypothetical protein
MKLGSSVHGSANLKFQLFDFALLRMLEDFELLGKFRADPFFSEPSERAVCGG